MFDGDDLRQGGAASCTCCAGLLGDEAWWKGIRGYVAEHKFQVVETDDFRKAMEAASGKDLKWFFDQWVYKAGHPELKVRWRYEDADKTVRVKVEQTQKRRRPDAAVPPADDAGDHRGRRQDAGSIPIVIDGAVAGVRHPGRDQAEDGPDRPAGLADQGARLREVGRGEPLPARACRRACWAGWTRPGRWPASGQGQPGISPGPVRGLEAGEEPSPARRQIVELMGNGDEAFRAALLEAAGDPEARVRVAAIDGLARLKHDDATEAILRAAWNNPKEAYGARRAALRGLVAWKVEDAPKLLDAALKIPADRHTIAATALEILLETPGLPRPASWRRSTAGTASPPPCGPTALGTFPRLAKDDPALQDSSST